MFRCRRAGYNRARGPERAATTLSSTRGRLRPARGTRPETGPLRATTLREQGEAVTSPPLGPTHRAAFSLRNEGIIGQR
jgi:hypothetical protein